MPGDSGLGGNLSKRQILLRCPASIKFATTAFNITGFGLQYFGGYPGQLIEGIFSGCENAVAPHQCSPGGKTPKPKRGNVGVDVSHMNHLQGHPKTFRRDLSKRCLLSLAHIRLSVVYRHPAISADAHDTRPTVELPGEWAVAGHMITARQSDTFEGLLVSALCFPAGFFCGLDNTVLQPGAVYFPAMNAGLVWPDTVFQPQVGRIHL